LLIAKRRLIGRCSAALLAALALGTAHQASAQGFLGQLFGGGFRREPLPPRSNAYADPHGAPERGESRHSSGETSGGSGRGTVFCVRTCDGRYFPVSANNEQSRAATCSSLCPASDTKIFYGSSIDHATSEGGKSYSSLPNAFKYREQLVSGCTCNGKDPVGLASISIEDDKTIRKGDIVAGENGLIVANRTADRKRGGVAEFSPAPQRIRAKFERSQALALQ
jgi:hypothetical protein